MSNASPSYDDRFVDLLIQRSTTGLSEADQQEFSNLAQSPKHKSEMERYDLTVAAVDLALGSGEREAMPRKLHDRLLMTAGSFFRDSSDVSPAVTSANEKVELSPRRAASRFSWREAVALAVTAACVMLVLNGFATQRGLERELADTQTVSQQRQERLDGLQGEFKDLTTQLADLRSAQQAIVALLTPDSKPMDLVQVQWEPVHEPKAAGEALWSDSRQEGYMRFANMPINNPSVEQYQLWIFDTEKEYAEPVDGGVFDISTAGEVIIPIKARMRIDKAVRFAVTVEKPGGVLVSKRERIPVQAFVN